MKHVIVALVVTLLGCLEVTVTTQPVQVYICLVNGDTIRTTLPDTTGVRCAAVDSVRVR